MRLGLLPAAGKAVRWGGYPKELLPIPSGGTFLARAVKTLEKCGCDAIVVVTNPEKMDLHASHLGRKESLVLAIQRGSELWGAISTGISVPADEYCFMMPDTYIPREAFPPRLKTALGAGLFQTDEPERFGTLRDGKIVDKRAGDRPSWAWGVLAWTRSVAEYWNSRSYRNHTQAMNDAIRRFGIHTWSLAYYYDIGSLEHYREFLRVEYGQELDGGNLVPPWQRERHSPAPGRVGRRYDHRLVHARKP